MVDNRRDATRYSVWFPLEVREDEDRRVVAITRDMSERGIRIATAERLEIGQSVRLTFTLEATGGTEQTVEGVIVRVEPQGGGPNLWRYQAAIRFDDSHPDLENLLADLADELPWARDDEEPSEQSEEDNDSRE